MDIISNQNIQNVQYVRQTVIDKDSNDIKEVEKLEESHKNSLDGLKQKA